MASWNHAWRKAAHTAVCALVALTVFAASAGDADAARKKTTKKKGKPAAAAASVSGVNDPRYADIILNPVTGEVYHQDSADERRYPASLTKMMTLYLLFEALAQDKTSLNAHLDVSDYAATMPQTNLSLESGDTIPVEIAIKALVVRSANDVSVVVAEALGGSVERFAQMMTAKARALGMNNTVFKNPNGLPNSGQYTTARDMAKLGIALKRDYPQYYDYFETRQFSWNGVTYYTHNRVMLRYAGTDGIKTGFIGASGFNVVTSVTRGGRPLVGVVMGGASGAWRDNRMIQLLDQSYKIIAERGAVRGKSYTQNLPAQKSAGGKQVNKGIKAQVPADVPDETPPLQEQPAVANDAGENEPAATPTPAPIAAPEAAPAPATLPAQTIKAAPKPMNSIRIVTLPPTPQNKPAPAAPAAAPQPIATPQPVATASGTYGIQVGAFSSAELADRAVNDAYALARPKLVGAQRAIAGPEIGGAPVHRARMVNLSEAQAKAACEVLIAHSTPCFFFRAN